MLQRTLYRFIQPSRKPMPIPAPFVWSDLKVLPEWVDENNHMNVAFYLKAFDDAFYGVYRAWGMDFAEVQRRGYTTFAAENHITYQGELFLDDAFSVETILLDFDRKRIGWFNTMRKADGSIAATCEWLLLFVNFHERRVATMPDEFFDALAAIKEAHDRLPRPAEAGRGIAIGNKRRG
jgi:acyl-CoA thioester hydrolase